MAVTIDPYVLQLAGVASGICGLETNVILAQWYVEEGVSSANWPSNNPAGLRPVVAGSLSNGDEAEQYATGVNASNFLIFPSPMAGAKAYAARIAQDSNYAGVRSAIKSGNPLSELAAIVISPWDSGHYGGDGHKLYDAYSAIVGVTHSVPPGLTFNDSATYAVGNSGNTAIKNQIDFPQTNYSIVANSQRTGNVLYGRQWRILVSNSSGIALDISDLHCTFDIQYVVNETPPFSTVEIYNLNPETENFIINYGDTLVVEAGYEGTQYGVIFSGEIVEPIRDKPDNVSFRLTLNALTANAMVNQSFVNFTINKGQNARSLLQNIASKATVTTPLGDISPNLSVLKLPRGRAVFGMTRKFIRQIAQANNMAFHLSNGKVNLLHAADPPKGKIIDLTPDSGLIGQPTQQDLGVSFQCLLNPAMQIDTLVHIDNTLIQAETYSLPLTSPPRALDSAGIYRIVGVEHTGDTRGDNWYTQCTTVSQLGGIPGMISATTDSLWGNGG